MKTLLIPIVLLAACGKDQPEAGKKNAPNKAYARGEDAPAGDVIHKIALAEVMDIIPAANAIERFKDSAEDQPAPDGGRWVHLKGLVKNNGKSEKSIKAISIYVYDGADKKYEMSTDVAWFVSSEKLPTSINVAPAGSAEWEAYFPVAKGASKFQFEGNDLQFVPDASVRVDLGF